jgi:hypothetical protein
VRPTCHLSFFSHLIISHLLSPHAGLILSISNLLVPLHSIAVVAPKIHFVSADEERDGADVGALGTPLSQVLVLAARSPRRISTGSSHLRRQFAPSPPIAHTSAAKSPRAHRREFAPLSVESSHLRCRELTPHLPRNAQFGAGSRGDRDRFARKDEIARC